MACIVCHAPLECNRSVTIGTMELPTDILGAFAG